MDHHSVIGKKFSVLQASRTETRARDYHLLSLVQNYFNCGSLNYKSSRNTYTFGVYNLNDLEKYIIPHFDKFPLRGVKYLDYIDFKKVLLIKKDLGPLYRGPR